MITGTTAGRPFTSRHQNSDGYLNGVSYRQLALPEVLKEIGKHLLTQFCERFQAELAAQDIALPDPHLPDHEYFHSFAALLKCPTLLPDHFKETLFDLEELA